MPDAEGKEPAKQPRRAKKGPSASPVDIDKPIAPAASPPTARLDEMTKGRISALEKDKRQLQIEVGRLQGRVDQLAPENSRLAESLANAEWNNVLAVILVS